MAGQFYYDHPTAGRLPLIEKPGDPTKLVAYLDGRPVYETDRASLESPKQTKKRRGAPQAEEVPDVTD